MGLNLTRQTSARRSPPGGLLRRRPYRHIWAEAHCQVAPVDVDPESVRADNRGVKTLILSGLVVWVLAGVLTVLVVAGKLERNGIEGIRRRHLWIVGVLAWPIIFIGSYFLMAWLVPFDAVCRTTTSDITSEINCSLSWALGFILAAAVVASLSVVFFVKWVHSRQEVARQIRKLVV